MRDTSANSADTAHPLHHPVLVRLLRINGTSISIKKTTTNASTAGIRQEPLYQVLVPRVHSRNMSMNDWNSK